MIKTRKFFLYLSLYFLIRLFSYFFSPPTPLVAGSIFNSLLATLIALLVVWLLAKKDWRGWLIVAGEILFCGSGNILSLGSVSLRTVLLIVGLSMYFLFALLEKITDKKKAENKTKGPNNTFAFNKLEIILPLALVFWMAVSALVGWVNNHSLPLIISDFIPYLFLLYFFPLRELMKNEKFKKEIFNMLVAVIVGCAAITLFTSLMFGFGAFVMQGEYYHWFRDVLGGKITDTGASFFRVTLNEHLLIVPLVLYFIKRMKPPYEFANDMVVVAAAVILSINLTRIYYLALLVGLIFLFTKKMWKQWLVNSLVMLFCVFGCFTLFHMIVSGPANPGWEYFGLRATSIVAPQIEDSSLSRMLLLPEIIKEIRQSVVTGNGLGDTITVFSPIFNQDITTPHFDWGWLEILAESGTIGLFIWLLFLCYLFRLIIQKATWEKSLLGVGIISLLVINITSPALFHVFGILFITVTLSHAFAEQSSLLPENPLPIGSAKAV